MKTKRMSLAASAAVLMIVSILAIVSVLAVLVTAPENVYADDEYPGFGPIPAKPAELVLDGQVSAEAKAANEVVTFKYTPEEDSWFFFYTTSDVPSESFDFDVCLFTADKRIGVREGERFISWRGYAGVTYYVQTRYSEGAMKYTAALENSDDIDYPGTEETLKIGGKDVVVWDDAKDDYVVDKSALPAGMTYDLPTRTLTLTDCTLDLSGMPKQIDHEAVNFITARGSLNIVLNGTNTFKGMKAFTESIFSPYGFLTITGSGSLTLELAGQSGIYYGHAIEIDGPTININNNTAESPKMFYGMTLNAWENCSTYFNTDDIFHISINNANINITSKSGDIATNMGMDSQDANFEIKNSKVNIDLTGGTTWGIGSGLYDSSDSTVHYGGKLSIDDKSRVMITLKDTAQDVIDKKMMYSLYFYGNDIHSKYIYASRLHEGINTVDIDEDFDYDGFIDRYEPQYTFIDFSPEKQDYPVEPECDHTMEAHPAIAATCETAGNSAYWYCTKCKKYYAAATGGTPIAENSWVIKALGHDWGEWEVVKEATYFDTGLKERVCSRNADHKETQVIPVIPIPEGEHVHVPVADPAIEPLCTIRGLTEGSHCAICGEILKEREFIPATGEHKLDEGRITKQATVFEEGEFARYCHTCGYKEAESIAKLTPTITLSAKSRNIKKGKSYTLKVSGLARGDSVKTVKSSKTKVATVKTVKKNNYKITGKKKGKATITVTLASGKKAKFTAVIK